MSERLTDGQLRYWTNPSYRHTALHEMATELIALRAERDEAIRQSQGYLKTARDCLDTFTKLRESLADARLGIAVLGDTCKHLGLESGQQSAIRMMERIDSDLAQPAESGATEPSDAAINAGVAAWPSSESYDERECVKEILAAAAKAEWLERFMRDDSGLPNRLTGAKP